MSILVTGGSGMIASRIVRDLVRNGEEVVCTDLVMDEEVLNYVLTDEDRKHITFVKQNILDHDAVLATCKENGVDKIVHCASMMGNAKNPIQSTHVNTGGMITILEVARELNVKKVVYSSTNSVYNTQNPKFLPNDAPFDPDTLYGCTKAFNEYVANLYYNKYDLDITGIRISALVYGPLQRRGISGMIATEALYKPATGQPGRCPYNDFGSWMLVDDVARAHVMALNLKRRPYMAGAYNIRGTVVDFPAMGEFVKSLVPDADVEFADAKFNQVYVNCDTTVTENELGFKPEWDIWDGFRFVINESRKAAGLPTV